MHPRRKRLHDLVEIHSLSVARLADLTGVSRTSAANWMRPESNASARLISETALELLEIKLDCWQAIWLDPDLYVLLERKAKKAGKTARIVGNEILRKALIE